MRIKSDGNESGCSVMIYKKGVHESTIMRLCQSVKQRYDKTPDSEKGANR